MNKVTTIILIALAHCLQAQQTPFVFDWTKIQTDSNLPQREASWIASNLSEEEITELFGLVTALSKPAAAQLLVGHLYLDGEFSRPWSKTYLDSLNVRPADGDAGYIRVAYLVANFRKSVNEYHEASSFYAAQFTGQNLQIPDINRKDINKDIVLTFDFTPSRTLLSILSEDDITYSEIVPMLNNTYWTELILHRSQSFYSRPSNTERIALCLEKAASTRPLDQLYRYMNPYGLLNFADVKANIHEYKQQIELLATNETVLSDFINSKISPLLPGQARFKRDVSFYFMNGADGWATENITAVDLNYFKSDYEKLLNLLVHESFHGGQNAVKPEEIRTGNSEDWLAMTLDYIFNEGTATYVAPPKIITPEQYEEEVRKGAALLDAIFTESAKPEPDENTLNQLINDGVSSAGPFYWIGAEMTKVIVDEMGKKTFANTIPLDGIAFTKTYIRAVRKSKNQTNIFGTELANHIVKM